MEMEMKNNFSTYSLRAEDLEKQKAVLDSMLTGNLAPLDLPQQGPVQAKINPMSLVLQALTGVAGEASKKRLAEEQQGLYKQYGEDKGKAMRSVLEAMQGGQTDPATGLQSKVSPMEAIVQAMSSDFPEIQALGAAMMKSQAEGTITPKDLLTHANPNSIPAMLQQGVGGFQPKKDLAFDDKFGWRDNNEGTFLPNAVPAPVNKTINGSLMQQYPTGVLDMVDKAPHVNVTNQMPAAAQGETALAKALGEQNAKGITGLSEEIKQAKGTLALTADLETINPDMMEGPTAPAELFLSKLANSLGVQTDAAKVKMMASEQGDSVLSKEIATYLTAGGGVGRSLTDADRQKIEQQWGTLSNTREGRQQIINFLREKASRTIDDNNRTLDELGAGSPGTADQIGISRTLGNTNRSPGIKPKAALPTRGTAPAGAKGYNTDTKEWVY